MISYLIGMAMQFRLAILVLAGSVVGCGIWAFLSMQVDAYPDISSNMVQVITKYPGKASEDVERQVTIPIEYAVLGAPKVEVVRSRTIFGLSVVQLIFEEGTDLYFARQRVAEKLNGLELPEGAKPELGPLATAYGEIYRYQLKNNGTHTLMEVREMNDWTVIPRMLKVPGVAECANFGGYIRQLTVTFYPAQLDRFGITFADIADAIQKNNTSAGGSVVNRGSMSLVVRSGGLIENAEQLGNIFVKSVAGVPIFIKDVAAIGSENSVPAGIFSKDLEGESVGGVVLMRRGENPTRVLGLVEKAVADLNESGDLPVGIRVEPYYNRQHLVDSTLHTVAHSVTLGITMVVLVLLLFLGRPSTAILVAVTIPFALLSALLLMFLTGIPIGLLSIGAIDFGIIVDAAVIVAENIARRLGEATHHHRQALAQGKGPEKLNVTRVVLAATREMERPVFFSVLMVMIAYLPLLSLTSIEGLLFRPMALTMVYALTGSMAFGLFVLPVAATYLFRNGYEEWENPLLTLFRPIYSFALQTLMTFRWMLLGAILCGLGFVAFRVVPHLGFEFLPYMDEGVVWVRANFPEGTSLEQTSIFGKRLRELALSLEDVDFAIVQAGRNDEGTDPFPPSRIEMMIGPKPRDAWRQFKIKRELVAAIGAKFRTEFPTTRFNFTQPIIDSVTEDTNGTSANLAVEFTGPESAVLLRLARKTVDLLRSVNGSQDVSIEQEGPQPQLVIKPNRQLCARYNVKIDDVSQMVSMAIGGEPVGTLYENERRFDIVCRFNKQLTDSEEAFRRFPVFSGDSQPIPLGQVAAIEVLDGQTLIAREGGKRRITVRCDIVGRDQAGFVQEAQKRFADTIQKEVPTGYDVGWLGMFQNLTRAKSHFAVLIPITILILFLFLVITFQSIMAAFLVMLGVPFACLGGILAIHFLGMNVNVSTGVGFCALFGIAIMDGVLLVKAINTLREGGMALREAIMQGAQNRLRPILMTAIGAILGILPASMATGLGSDVQRPLATVIVWGLFSSTILNLLVLPVLYLIIQPPVIAKEEPASNHPDGEAPQVQASMTASTGVTAAT